MRHQIGRITLAASLIVVGALLIYDNIYGTGLIWWAARLWPALLILLGLEWVVASSVAEEKARVDAGAIALLVIGAIILGAAGTARHTIRTISAAPWEAGGRIQIGPFFSTGSSQFRSERLTTTLDLPDGLKHLAVDVSSATVTVQPGAVAQAELTVQAYGRSAADADVAAREARLRLIPGNPTRLTLELPNGYSWQTLAIRVTLPEPVELTVQSSSGTVAVQGRSAPVTVQSSSGAIRVEEISGQADLRSSSGAISAKGIGGPLRAIASSGAIRVDGVQGDAEISTSSGSIVLSYPAGRVSAKASSGSVTVESDRVGGPYDLGAVSGSVRLLVPSSAGIKVDARASSGNVSGPNWLTIGEGRSSGRGAQGDGLIPVTIRTSSGSITITSR